MSTTRRRTKSVDQRPKHVDENDDDGYPAGIDDDDDDDDDDLAWITLARIIISQSNQKGPWRPAQMLVNVHDGVIVQSVRALFEAHTSFVSRQLGLEPIIQGVTRPKLHYSMCYGEGRSIKKLHRVPVGIGIDGQPEEQDEVYSDISDCIVVSELGSSRVADIIAEVLACSIDGSPMHLASMVLDCSVDGPNEICKALRQIQYSNCFRLMGFVTGAASPVWSRLTSYSDCALSVVPLVPNDGELCAFRVGPSPAWVGSLLYSIRTVDFALVGGRSGSSDGRMWVCRPADASLAVT